MAKLTASQAIDTFNQNIGPKVGLSAEHDQGNVAGTGDVVTGRINLCRGGDSVASIPASWVASVVHYLDLEAKHRLATNGVDLSTREGILEAVKHGFLDLASAATALAKLGD